MNTRRKPLTKKVRFEVFKRDHFTCQYCGRMAPDVILEVDHINPVAEGGTNDLVNLITSCRDCNRGKGKRKLSDSAEVKKQQEMLKELASKREQIEMMVEWKQELLNVEKQEVEQINELFKEFSDGHNELNVIGKRDIAKYIKKYSFKEVYDATEAYLEQYLTTEDGETFTLAKPFYFISAICKNKREQVKNPMIYLINKIVYRYHKKFTWKDKWKIKNLIAANIKTEQAANVLLDHYDYYSKMNWAEFSDFVAELGELENTMEELKNGNN